MLENINKNFVGEVVRITEENFSISKDQFAEAIGVSKKTLSEIEGGRQNLTLTQTYNFLEFSGVKYNELISGKLEEDLEERIFAKEAIFKMVGRVNVWRLEKIDYKKIGIIIRKKRETMKDKSGKKMSQMEFASEIEVYDGRVVCTMEAGKKEITLEQINKIIEVTGMSFHEIMFGQQRQKAKEIVEEERKLIAQYKESKKNITLTLEKNQQ